MGTNPNEYTLERDPELVQIADLDEYGSNRSSVNGKPICARNGTDPFGSRRYLNFPCCLAASLPTGGLL